jgi:hypothetical protein
MKKCQTAEMQAYRQLKGKCQFVAAGSRSVLSEVVIADGKSSRLSEVFATTVHFNRISCEILCKASKGKGEEGFRCVLPSSIPTVHSPH